MSFLNQARRITNKLGLEVTRLRDVRYSQSARLALALNSNNVDLILDVGANDGGYAQELRLHGFSGEILSFEPLTAVHKILKERSKRDAKWIIYERTAIGDQDGEMEINIAQNSVSSSILQVDDLHVSVASGVRTIAVEKTPIRRLDSIDNQSIRSAKRPFIKVDTQGYEPRVLDGAVEILKRAVGIQIELSIVPLYAKQSLYLELVHRVQELGFELWGVMPGFVDTATGRTLQFDGVFFRPFGLRLEHDLLETIPHAF